MNEIWKLTTEQRAMPGRGRRLRSSPALRRIVRETRLSPDDFIYPLFVTHGLSKPIASMPGISQFATEDAVREAEKAASMGIPAVLLFGIPAEKDPVGVENFSERGIIARAVRAIKRAVPDLIVITDVCMCEYTDHGHCGILNVGAEGKPYPHLPENYVLNDETLQVLDRVAVAHGEAGADLVAPSGMMDGMVGSIRSALDDGGLSHVGILSYSVKYASSFYGPFREAAEGAPLFGDRKTHQMDPCNAREALREAQRDIEEGADLLMVKPALAYLDVIHRLRERFDDYPLVAYNVSGEYAMIKAAAANGWIDERSAALETLIGIKRAGADAIITYHAIQAVPWLK